MAEKYRAGAARPVALEAPWIGVLRLACGAWRPARPMSGLPAASPIRFFLAGLLAFFALLAFAGCGAKGDPKPYQRFAPTACAVRAVDIRTIEVVLPKTDTQGNQLSAIEAVRIYYLSLGTKFPSSMEVYRHGEAILERRRQDLPPPGETLRLSLSHFGRPAGWLVVVPFRAVSIPGEPSVVLPWLDPSF